MGGASTKYPHAQKPEEWKADCMPSTSPLLRNATVPQLYDRLCGLLAQHLVTPTDEKEKKTSGTSADSSSAGTGLLVSLVTGYLGLGAVSMIFEGQAHTTAQEYAPSFKFAVYLDERMQVIHPQGGSWVPGTGFNLAFPMSFEQWLFLTSCCYFSRFVSWLDFVCCCAQAN